MLIHLVIILTLVIAGLVRGYTGFGFSALVILVLSMFYSVADMVPAVLMVDLIVSLPLVVDSWNKTNFSALTPVLVTTGIGIPVGFWLLFNLPDSVLRILVPTTVLLLAIMSKSRGRLIKKLSGSALLCGFMSGWTTSAVSAGGAPVVIYMRNSALSVEHQRNSLISYFFLTTCFAVGSSYAVTKQWQVLPDFPVLYTGIAFVSVLIGKAIYHYKNVARVHSLAYYLLLIVSALTLFRAAWMLLI
ncbi:TSUP family transporter [Vibrio sp. 10N.261.51.F12]|uniref:TSUP family transporter n=1 Tax=Vibrio sp. 10N.261.51.F12 TaxID=3229679 RepID=UPI003552D6AB